MNNIGSYCERMNWMLLWGAINIRNVYFYLLVYDYTKSGTHVLSIIVFRSSIGSSFCTFNPVFLWNQWLEFKESFRDFLVIHRNLHLSFFLIRISIWDFTCLGWSSGFNYFYYMYIHLYNVHERLSMWGSHHRLQHIWNQSMYFNETFNN